MLSAAVLVCAVACRASVRYVPPTCRLSDMLAYSFPENGGKPLLIYLFLFDTIPIGMLGFLTQGETK